MLDIEVLLDNAATASQERRMLRDDDGDETPLREAVRRNCIEPLLDELRYYGKRFPGDTVVEVTEEDIRKSRRYNERYTCKKTGQISRDRPVLECPVARALSRELGVPDVVTHDDYVKFPQYHWIVLNLPREVADTLHEFRAGGEIRPFSFPIPFGPDNFLPAHLTNVNHGYS